MNIKGHSAVTTRRVSRRQVLGTTGLGCVTSLGALTGCTDTSDVPDTTAKAKVGDFQIPDNPDLPTSDVTLRWTDSGDQKALFFKAFFDAYHKLHPNITVDYSGTNWPTIQKEITLGVRNGTAPDVFALPSSITLAQAVANKWVGAFDDIVPDWSTVKGRFPKGFFASGITDFDGKSYGFPITSSYLACVLLHNKTLTSDLGYDLDKPITYDDFRALAQKITTKGDGKYYGLIMGLAQPNQLSGPVDTMCGDNTGRPDGVVALSRRPIGHRRFALCDLWRDLLARSDTYALYVS